MTARGLGASALVLALGWAITGGLYWLLLNVPESTVAALVASLLLALAAAACAGITTGAAAALAHGMSPRQAFACGVSTLPHFAVGLAVGGALWWLTGAAALTWDASRGEIDALAIRYLGTDRTQPVHAAADWLLWLVRWGLGLSLLCGLTTAASLPPDERRTPRGFSAGLRAGVAVVSLSAVVVAVVVVAEGLWRLAYWRPSGLPASSAEILFVAAKLAGLYATTIALATGTLAVVGRAARRAAIAHPASDAP